MLVQHKNFGPDLFYVEIEHLETQYHRSLLLQGGCYFSSAPDSLVLQVIIYDADPMEWKVLETLRDLVFAGNHLSP